MNFLPIVERELRTAARRPSTYWLRFFIALATLGLWALLMMAMQGTTMHERSQKLVNAMGVLSLGFCLLSGSLFTADCISEEKRNGTLGLLFLTDLKSFDVVLGKLVATSLHAFYGLLVIFPIMALTLLWGGVTSGECGRLVLVLLATLFLSLSSGLCVSSLFQDTRLVLAGAFLLMLFMTGMLPLVGWLICLTTHSPPVGDFWLWPSPGYAYHMAFDASYRSSIGPASYWGSLSVLLVLCLVFLGLAFGLLPRGWKERSSTSQKNIGWRLKQRLRYGNDLSRMRLREREMNINPFGWLILRDRFIQIAAEGLLKFLFPIWFIVLLFAILSSRNNKEYYIICLFSAFAMHLLFKGLVAMEASRRFFDDRQSGVLELLLVSPLSQTKMVAGMWAALEQHLRNARRILLLINSIFVGSVIFWHQTLSMSSGDQKGFLVIFVGGMVVLILDYRALIWTGMWMGLRAKKYHRAVLASLTRVLVLPWVGIILMVFGELYLSRISSQSVYLVFAAWFLLGITNSLLMGKWAKKRLHQDFRVITTPSE